eukprot:SAG22_NODE_620_length_8513_cov_3.934870_6_plen_121_part_00
MCENTAVHNCGSSEAVLLVCSQTAGAAQCPPPPPVTGLRLYGGYRGDGILEAYTGSTWGPVCDDYFDQDDKGVEVICRQLGYLDADGGQTDSGSTCWPPCSVQCGDLSSARCTDAAAGGR